jgi:hypothetical protein
LTPWIDPQRAGAALLARDHGVFQTLAWAPWRDKVFVFIIKLWLHRCYMPWVQARGRLSVAVAPPRAPWRAVLGYVLKQMQTKGEASKPEVAPAGPIAG